MSSQPAQQHHAYPGLNGLRAAGAIMVVATHCGFDTARIVDGWTGGLLARLNIGVTIFFVLSGFLLSQPFFVRAAQDRPAPSTAHYFWKRALRILPLYWVVVAAVAFTEPANRGLISGQMWLRNLTLTQLYKPDLLPTGLTQMWSLATEVAFYLVLPLLCAALLGRRRQFSERRMLVLLGLIALAGVVWQASVGPIPGREGHFEQWLPGYLPWFCIGMAFAVVSTADLSRRPTHLFERMAADPAGCWLAAALIYGIACTPLVGARTLVPPTSWEAGLRVVLYGLAGGLLVLPMVFGRLDEGPIRRLCNHRISFFLGEISYGIFCVHLIVLHAVFRRTGIGAFQGHFGEVFAMTLIGSIVLATLAYYVIEMPFMRLRNIGPFGRETTGTAAASAAVSTT